MPISATIREVAGSLVTAARSEQFGFLAAAIAYYTFVSIVPLVLLGLAAASVLGGDAFAAAVLQSIDDFLTPDAAALVGDALTSGAGRGGATALGLLVLGWSALRIFRGLNVAFSLVYDDADATSLATQIRDSVLAFGAIAVAVLAMAALVTVLPVLDVPFPALVRSGVTALALSALLFPLYYVFPNRNVGVREALPGAVFAGVGWTLLAMAFSLYAAYAASYRLYGVLGGVLLVLTWFYAGGYLLLLGAKLNAVLAGYGVDRQLQQEPGRRVS